MVANAERSPARQTNRDSNHLTSTVHLFRQVKPEEERAKEQSELALQREMEAEWERTVENYGKGGETSAPPEMDYDWK